MKLTTEVERVRLSDQLEFISARQMSWATLQDGVFEKLVSEVVLF